MNGINRHLVGSLVGAIVVVPIASIVSMVTQEHRTMAVTWVKVRHHGIVHHVHWHAVHGVLVWPLGTNLDITGHCNCSYTLGGHPVQTAWVWESQWGIYLGLYHMSGMPLDPGSPGKLGN